MDKQSKMKPSNMERYKSGESKFMSLEQSRQLRALKKRHEQKNSRDVILKKMRGVTSDTPQTKPGQCSQPVSQAPSAKKLSKNELKELGIKRYHEMLRWKEEKRKLLEKEKRARKPVFKTGVVQPDKPQYLQDAYVDKKAQTTPFKFNVLSRDSAKKSFISSVSKENLNILGISSMKKALSFHSGATPQTSGAPSSVAKIVGGRRANRVFRPPPEFGITPLPKTPSLETVKSLPKTPRPVAPSRSFNILKESKSFAPNTFNFQAPEGLRRYTIKQPSSLHSVYNSPSKKEELEFAKEVGLQILENDRSGEEEPSSENLENNEFERSSLRDTYLIDNNKDKSKSESEALDSENVLDLKENLQIDEEDDDMKHAGEIEQSDENLKENEKTFEVVEIDSNLREKIDEHEVKTESEQMDISSEDSDTKVMVQDVKCEISGFEEEINSGTPPTLPVEDEKERLVENSKNNKNLSELNDRKPEIKKDNNEIREYLEDDKENIKKKTINIKSSTKKRSKSLSKFTPPLSKLRPRTPCSRSTRRSLLAHCNTPCFGDHNPITTPISRRRKSKKSLTLTANTDLVSEPAENFINTIPEINSVNKTPSLSTEDDIPNSTPLSQERINQLEYSPWITRSRGSDSSNSSKRKSVFKTKIEGELKTRFDELYKSPWISKSRGSSKSLKRKKPFSDPSAKRIQQLERSPWITTVRGSSSLSKNWKRKSILERDYSEQVKNLASDVGSPALKKRSWFPLAIESFPPSGSKTEEPINVGSVKVLCDVVGSPLLKESLLFDNEVSFSSTIVPSLPEGLVQRQTEGISESPDVCVWGPDSATNSPVVAVTELPNCDNSSEIKLETESNRKAKRRSSKRVSLFVDPDKENTDDISGIKYPVTPRRRSLRISTVGSQRVSLLPGLYPHDENIETISDLANVDCDLISLDSPAVAAPGGNGKLKSRLSQRVSLLPGLSSHPEVEDQSPQYPINEESDLISWDSPLVTSGRRKSRKKSNADTPLRRSKRFSKI